jgi:hypothetical protein
LAGNTCGLLLLLGRHGDLDRFQRRCRRWMVRTCARERKKKKETGSR